LATATLVDPPVQVDFSRLTSAKDVVTILSTEPLTTDELLCPHNP
jgi:predicted glutamine amidotransferase